MIGRTVAAKLIAAGGGGGAGAGAGGGGGGGAGDGAGGGAGAGLGAGGGGGEGLLGCVVEPGFVVPVVLPGTAKISAEPTLVPSRPMGSVVPPSVPPVTRNVPFWRATTAQPFRWWAIVADVTELLTALKYSALESVENVPPAETLIPPAKRTPRPPAAEPCCWRAVESLPTTVKVLAESRSIVAFEAPVESWPPARIPVPFESASKDAK